MSDVKMWRAMRWRCGDMKDAGNYLAIIWNKIADYLVCYNIYIRMLYLCGQRHTNIWRHGCNAIFERGTGFTLRGRLGAEAVIVAISKRNCEYHWVHQALMESNNICYAFSLSFPFVRRPAEAPKTAHVSAEELPNVLQVLVQIRRSRALDRLGLRWPATGRSASVHS